MGAITNNTTANRKEISILNWNFEIQNSGSFQRQFLLGSKNNVSNHKRFLRIEYFRDESSDVGRNTDSHVKYKEMLQINGEFKARNI